MANPISATKQSKKNVQPVNSFPGNKFPTIGLLTEGLSGQYQSGVWPGIVDAARASKVNIISFCGGSLNVSTENPWDYQANILFKIARQYPLDGLIIAGSIGCYVTDSAFDEFLAGYRHLKIITIAPAVESLPAVYVDNRSGMTSLVTHLLESHACKKIAFIKGPDRNIEAEERFAVFRDVMARHRIPLDPLRIMQGDFTRGCGVAAVEKLVASAIEFDAIVAANDDSALGALQALREKGIRVPEDVAVVGFDDIDESGFVTPPLTTVHQPLYDLGKLAVEKLLQLIKGEEVPKNNIVDAQLVVRQSCGCFKSSANGAGHFSESSPAALPGGLVEAEAMTACLSASGRPYEKEIREIVSAFCTDVAYRTGEIFLRTVDRVVHQQSLPVQESAMKVWVTVFDRLWQYAYSRLERPVFAAADSLIHRALLLCGSLGTRDQGIRRIRSAQKNSMLRQIGNAFNNTLDVDKLMDSVTGYFPRLGLRTFSLSLYENPETAPAGKSRLKCALIDGNTAADKTRSVFETMSLTPDGMVSGDAVRILVAEALYFQKEQFGIALFEAGREECWQYHALKEYISSALHSAALMRKVRRQADVLSKANGELKKLREEEHAYLQAIKRELELGRKIQMGFLPHKLPQVPGWDIAAAFEPAREVSGDFYDAFTLDEDRIALVIADVSGKDVSAALFMSLIRTLIRVFAERAGASGDDPLDAIKVVNDYILRHHFPGNAQGSMFATIVFGILHPSSGEFRYINAGHIAPMIIGAKGEISVLAPTGMAVGLAPQSNFGRGSIRINPGDLFFLYTDGVTEAKNPAGEFFTKERLKKLLMAGQAAEHAAQEKVALISTTIIKHNGGAAPYDDITMLAVKRV